MTIAPEGPNAEQVRYWNEMAGPKWVRFRALIDEQIRPLGERAMEKGAIAAGESVIDVGCGCGDTTLAIGRRVGPGGSVVGLDLSVPMLAEARREAERQGLRHVRFENVDAETHSPGEGRFDVVYSRFGVMFFARPEAAFANLRGALRPGGRLAFVCWQALPQNPWMFVPLQAALEHVTLQPPGPTAPGPFSFADPARVRTILETAGFSDVSLEGHEEVLTVGGGGDLDATIDFLLQIGPVGTALREVTDPSLAGKVAASVRKALEPYQGARGLRLSSASWMVTAVV